MRWLLLGILALAGCASSTPVTTTVLRRQEYNPPPFGHVTWAVVPAAASPCGRRGIVEPYGCVEGIGTKSPRIWIHSDHSGFEVNDSTIKHVLSHEFEHIVYGPRHTQK